MSEGMYILIFMVLLFSSIYLWAFVFSERKERRKEREKERKEEEKELKFQKLKEDAVVRRAEIDEKYNLDKQRRKEIKKEMKDLTQWKEDNSEHFV